jgi:hypothetical protein
MSNRNKDKGKGYENKVAKFIHASLYRLCYEYKDMFDALGNINLQPRREKSSGTTKHADNDIDMGLALKWFPFSVECKHNAGVNKIGISAILNKSLSFLKKTMQQAERHGAVKNLKPLVFFRGNFTDDMVMFRTKDIDIKLDGLAFVAFDECIVILASDFMERYFSK